MTIVVNTQNLETHTNTHNAHLYTVQMNYILIPLITFTLYKCLNVEHFLYLMTLLLKPYDYHCVSC